MHKGICFYFGYEVKPKDRVKLIKDAGFDSIITAGDKRFVSQNGTLRQQVRLFKKNELRLSSLHMRYFRDELPFFWKEGKLGEKLKKNLIKDVKNAKKYGFTCVVVHLIGEYSLIGEMRLKQILKVCEKVNIPLAIENMRQLDLFTKVFEKIKHPMLKFCLDIGHNNAYSNGYDYFEKFDNKLIALHLHNNDSFSDQHTLYGNVDWQKLGQNLKTHKDISLDFELIPRPHPDMSANEFLDEAKKLADKLEDYIIN